MRTTRILLRAAGALIIGAGSAFAQEQSISGTELEPGGIEYRNAAAIAVDVSTDAGETIGIDTMSGDHNLQDNGFSLTFAAGDAHSVLRQSLLGSSAALAGSRVRNDMSASIGAPDGVSGNAGVNVAAGAFNIQRNAAAIVVMPASTLAQSYGAITQQAAGNLSAHHDVVNNVTAAIALDTVSGNIGINLASGTGNVQLNTATTALSF